MPVCLAVSAWAGAAGASEPGTVAQPAPSPARAVVLRYRFAEGDAATYRLLVRGKGTIAAGGTRVLLPVSLELELEVARRVVRVSANGRAEVALTGTLRRLRVNGDPAPAQGPPPWSVVVSVSPSGAVHEWRAQPGTRPLAAPGVDAGQVWGALQRVAFPEHPVQPGDAWPPDALTPDGERQQTTFLALEESGRRRVARLRHAFALPVRVETSGPGAAPCTLTGRHAGDLTVRFDVTGGTVLDATGTVDVAATLATSDGTTTDVRWHLSVRVERL